MPAAAQAVEIERGSAENQISRIGSVFRAKPEHVLLRDGVTSVDTGVKIGHESAIAVKHSASSRASTASG